MQQISELNEWISGWDKLKRTLDDTGSLIELAEESQDASLSDDQRNGSGAKPVVSKPWARSRRSKGLHSWA